MKKEKEKIVFKKEDGEKRGSFFDELSFLLKVIKKLISLSIILFPINVDGNKEERI